MVNAVKGLLELRLLGVVESAGQQGDPIMHTYPYEQVAETIRGRIRDGTYPPGSRLPSRKAMSEEFGYSDIVVGAAMRTLKQEGLVETLPGVAAYVAGGG